MPLQKLMHWLRQFPGRGGLGLGAFPGATYGLGTHVQLYTRLL